MSLNIVIYQMIMELPERFLSFYHPLATVIFFTSFSGACRRIIEMILVIS